MKKNVETKKRNTDSIAKVRFIDHILRILSDSYKDN